MMNATTRVGHANRVRHGACQRCGWTELLLRTPQHLRARGDHRHYRWMCADCLADLGQDALPSPVLRAGSRGAGDTRLVA